MLLFQFAVPLFFAELHEAGVHGKPVKPGGKGTFSTKFLNGGGNLHKDVHQDVFGLVPVLKHLESEVQHMTALLLPEHGKSFAAAAFQAFQDDFFVHSAIWMRGKGTGLQEKSENFPCLSKNILIFGLF